MVSDLVIKIVFTELMKVTTGVPHKTMKEDEYRGMRIPKGKSNRSNYIMALNTESES